MKDSSYKKEVIMSLARYSILSNTYYYYCVYRQGEEVVFDIALSLSVHHSINEWELYMRHLDWLLTESG